MPFQRNHIPRAPDGDEPFGIVKTTLPYLFIKYVKANTIMNVIMVPSKPKSMM